MDGLYVDLNSLLYQAASRVLANPPADIAAEICRLLVVFLDELIFDIVKPSELVYLAVDGVAPLGKVAQQRLRRRRNRKMSDAPWDMCNITPGTAFMSVQVNAVLTWYAASRQAKFKRMGAGLVRFCISGSDVPGEGEQKILSFIRAMQGNADLVHCICSNDSDVIVASLALHCPKVTVLHYEPQNEMASSQFSVLDFRRSLWERFGRPATPTFERSLHDLVFIMLLFGNDFLPPIPWMDIGSGQLDALIDFLKTDFVVRGKHLVSEGDKLDPQAVGYFLANFEREIASGTAAKSGGSKLQIVTDSDGYDPFVDSQASGLVGSRTKASNSTIDAYWDGLQWLHTYQTTGV